MTENPAIATTLMSVYGHSLRRVSDDFGREAVDTGLDVASDSWPNSG